MSIFHFLVCVSGIVVLTVANGKITIEHEKLLVTVVVVLVIDEKLRVDARSVDTQSVTSDRWTSKLKLDNIDTGVDTV